MQFVFKTGLRRATHWMAAVGFVAVGAMTTTATANAAEYEFRLGHPLQPADATHAAMLYFADSVKRATGGRVEITVFPADQLGRQKEVGEMLVQGANIMQYTDFLFLAEWVPDAGILQAPFLLDDINDWYKLSASAWMADLGKRLQEKGIFVMTWNSYFGARNLIGPKPVRTPADIAGATLREANAPMYVKMAEAWGARPVVMGFAEVYTALSQNVVDFVEVPMQVMISSKFTELRKFVSVTNHMVNWNPVIVNDAAFHAMPEDLQKIVIEAAERSSGYLAALKQKDDKEVVAKLEGMGITVVKDVDRKAFREASTKVYEAFPDWTPGLGKTVRAILEK